MPDPDIIAAAQAIRPLMPTGVKNVPWDQLEEAAQDRLKEIATACCAAAYPASEGDVAEAPASEESEQPDA